MKIDIIKVGLLKTNCYLVTQAKSCFLIDPGGEADKILEKLKGYELKFILLTHGHFDHILALQEITKVYSRVKVYLNKSDWSLTNNAAKDASTFGFNVKYNSMQYCNTPNKLNFGNKQIKIIETPGHTPGSVCYLLDDILFSGDTLFYHSIGRTDLKGGNLTVMQKSLQKLAKLPENIKILPGHGTTTTIAQEKQYGYL